MGPQRGSSKIYDRSQSTRIIKPYIDIICEGHTEEGYLKSINKEFSEKHSEIIPVDKGFIDNDLSDRKKLVDFVIEYMWQQWKGIDGCKLRRFVTIMLNELYLKSDCAANIEDLGFFRDTLYEKLKDESYTNEKGFVVDPDYLYKIIKKAFIDQYGVEPSTKIIPCDMIKRRSGRKEGDTVCFMFDRDHNMECMPPDYFIDCVEYCKKENNHFIMDIEPLVSSPQFELWLLMHYKDVPLDTIRYNTYGDGMMARIKDIEGYHNWEKGMPPERYDLFYRGRVSTAIERSENPPFDSNSNFTDDPEKMGDKAGTNLGSFFRKALDLDDC